MSKPVSKRTRFRLAMRRIRSQFPDMPEARLMLAVIERVARDLISGRPDPSAAAARYFRGTMFHAQVCGVDPEWVRATLKKLDLLPAPESADAR